ncbi:MAG: aminotransferase class V-fold PLP-dependent enzyme [Pseudolysinimonas sp.]|uniref:kynureninase n=1 Tax=Pseudolysinimonas sp. TaxID=2680009 RepID=UPI0032670F27
MSDLRERAAELDAADPLHAHVDRFVPAAGVRAYLDGNSLGRPLSSTVDRLGDFVRDDWGTRLIRSWDEGWMERPFELGDRIARLTLGAAAGQTLVADSTTVLLYKLLDAAAGARADRHEIAIESTNFPTDRFIAHAVAERRGMTLRWIDADPVTGVSPEQVDRAVGEQTAVVLLNHVDYRSGSIADLTAITARVHTSGALMLWDLCHSAGVVPVDLDAADVDLAVGCTYKYLNGGPGSPAFGYVAARHQENLRQPIEGWMGAGNVFAMAREYTPAAGMRRFLSGTPPILGMLAIDDMLDLIEEAGVDAIRAKSISLTSFVVSAADELLPGVRLLSPRDAALRGGHVTLGHPDFESVVRTLWGEGIIPDFRYPDGLRLGLSPLSTTHAEALEGVLAIRDALGA